MNSTEWFEKYTLEANQYKDIKKLVELKKKNKETISVIIPTLNEAKTVSKVIGTIQEMLMQKHKLVDEIVVMDSGSRDDTVKIARRMGVKAYVSKNILKKYGDQKGKGENLWKGLFTTSGSIICWVDADIKNMHSRFVYGLVGPLLRNKKLRFTKPFYKRPIKIGDKVDPLGGGRVTEILIRPLFNQYFPSLSGFIQPLSGEAAGRRNTLERLPFFTGYGIETAMLIDMQQKFGLNTIAQVNLYNRVHRNRPISDLSKMSFAILQVFAKRANTLGRLIHVGDTRHRYRIIARDNEGKYNMSNRIIEDKQRPPMITLPEYRKIFKKDPKWMYA